MFYLLQHHSGRGKVCSMPRVLLSPSVRGEGGFGWGELWAPLPVECELGQQGCHPLLLSTAPQTPGVTQTFAAGPSSAEDAGDSSRDRKGYLWQQPRPLWCLGTARCCHCKDSQQGTRDLPPPSTLPHPSTLFFYFLFEFFFFTRSVSAAVKRRSRSWVAWGPGGDAEPSRWCHRGCHGYRDTGEEAATSAPGWRGMRGWRGPGEGPEAGNRSSWMRERLTKAARPRQRIPVPLGVGRQAAPGIKPKTLPPSQPTREKPRRLPLHVHCN